MGSVLADWSNLPRDVLSAIANLLDVEDDLWRLRAVCSAWRSCVSHLTFIIKIPSPNRGLLMRCFALIKSTVYCVYPPGGGSGKRNGWMFKVSETRRDCNTFSLRAPLSSKKIDVSIGKFLETLSRADCRITEICRSYNLEVVYHGQIQFQTEASHLVHVRRTIVLKHYVMGCDFVVMVLTHRGLISFWRRGDLYWTFLQTDENSVFDDIVLYEGKCYAISNTGTLFSIDSSLRVTRTNSSMGIYTSRFQLYSLVVGLNSELYMVPNHQRCDYNNFTKADESTIEPPMQSKVFKLNKRTQDWDCVTELGNQVILFGYDVTFCVSAEDFDGLNKNCVYVANDKGRVFGEEMGIYDVANWELGGFALGTYYHCTPSWLMKEAGLSEC